MSASSISIGRNGWLTLTLAATLLLASAPAHAFVCSRAVDEARLETGSALTWPTRNLTYALQQDGTNRIAANEEFDVLATSFDAWQGTTECQPLPRTTDLTFQQAPSLSASRAVGYDFLNDGKNENLLLFYDTGWPHPAEGDLVIALTTTTYVALTGSILDADIEFNSEHIDFSICGTASSPCDGSGGLREHDLMNTAVHEIGHFIGLGHTTDPDTTMFSQADPGETHKRTLDNDDRNAIVAKYPASAPSDLCSPPVASCGFCAPPGILTRIPEISVVDTDDGRGGCHASGGAAGLGAVLLLLLGLARQRRA